MNLVEDALDWGGNEDDEIYEQEQEQTSQEQRNARTDEAAESLVALRNAKGTAEATTADEEKDDDAVSIVSVAEGDDDMEQLYAYQNKNQIPGGEAKSAPRYMKRANSSDHAHHNPATAVDRDRHREPSPPPRSHSPPPATFNSNSSHSSSKTHPPVRPRGRHNRNQRGNNNNNNNNNNNSNREGPNSTRKSPLQSRIAQTLPSHLPRKPVAAAKAAFGSHPHPSQLSASSMTGQRDRDDHDRDFDDRGSSRRNEVKLAPGWERRFSQNGEEYFFNRKTERTTWDVNEATGRNDPPRGQYSLERSGSRSSSRGRGRTPPPPPAQSSSRNGKDFRRGSRYDRDDRDRPPSPMNYNDRHYVPRDDDRDRRPVGGPGHMADSRQRSPSPENISYRDSYRGNDRDDRNAPMSSYHRRDRVFEKDTRNPIGERRVDRSRSRSPGRSRWRANSPPPNNTNSWNHGRGVRGQAPPPSVWPETSLPSPRMSGANDRYLPPETSSYRDRPRSPPPLPPLQGQRRKRTLTPPPPPQMPPSRKRTHPISRSKTPPLDDRDRRRSPPPYRPAPSQPIASGTGNRWERGGSPTPARWERNAERGRSPMLAPRRNPTPPRGLTPPHQTPPLSKGQDYRYRDRSPSPPPPHQRSYSRDSRDDRFANEPLLAPPRTRGFERENEAKRQRRSDVADSASARRQMDEEREFQSDERRHKRAPLPPQDEEFKEVVNPGGGGRRRSSFRDAAPPLPPPGPSGRNIPDFASSAPRMPPPPPPPPRNDDDRRWDANDDRDILTSPYDRRGPGSAGDRASRSPAVMDEMLPPAGPSGGYGRNQGGKGRFVPPTQPRPPPPANLSGPNSVPVVPRIRMQPPPHPPPAQDDVRRSPVDTRDRVFDRDRDMRDEPPKGMVFGGRVRGNSFTGGPPQIQMKPRAPSASPRNHVQPLPDTRRPSHGRRAQSYQYQSKSNNYASNEPTSSSSGPSRWNNNNRVFEPRQDYREPPPPRSPGPAPRERTPDLEHRLSRSPVMPYVPMVENPDDRRRDDYPPPPRVVEDYPMRDANDELWTSQPPAPAPPAPPVHPERLKLIKDVEPPPQQSPGGGGGGGRGRRKKNPSSHREFAQSRGQGPESSSDVLQTQRPSKQNSLLDRLSNPSPEALRNGSGHSQPSLVERVGRPPNERGTGWKRNERNGSGNGQSQDSNPPRNQGRGMSLQERLEAAKDEARAKKTSGNGFRGERDGEGQRGGRPRRGRGN